MRLEIKRLLELVNSTFPPPAWSWLHPFYFITYNFKSVIYIYIYIYMKSSFPKRYKSILIVFMKMTFFYLDPYILLIFNLSC